MRLAVNPIHAYGAIRGLSVDRPIFACQIGIDTLTLAASCSLQVGNSRIGIAPATVTNDADPRRGRGLWSKLCALHAWFLRVI